MITHRSTGLALAALLALSTSSCLFGSHHDQHSLAVKTQADGDFAHAQSVQRSSVHQPEFFEGSTAPAAPAALPETRPSAPSPAHVWIAGEHTRRDGQWAWVPGHYSLPPRADVVWVPGHWVDHLNGYAWIAGAWR